MYTLFNQFLESFNYKAPVDSNGNFYIEEKDKNGKVIKIHKFRVRIDNASAQQQSTYLPFFGGKKIKVGNIAYAAIDEVGQKTEDTTGNAVGIVFKVMATIVNIVVDAITSDIYDIILAGADRKTSPTSHEKRVALYNNMAHRINTTNSNIEVVQLFKRNDLIMWTVSKGPFIDGIHKVVNHFKNPAIQQYLQDQGK